MGVLFRDGRGKTSKYYSIWNFTGLIVRKFSRQGQKIYVQVAYKLENEQTVEREFENLLTVKDQYPKYVVSMDVLWKETVESVPHYKISDFLLSGVF